jgi:acylphosphatase
VQAVGFRAATLRQAAALRLKGWARNLPDGSVEVVAAGDAPALAALANWLWQGPRGARVTAVTLEEWPSGVPAGFSIR